MPRIPPNRSRHFLVRFASALIGYLTVGAVLGIAIAFRLFITSLDAERQPPGALETKLLAVTVFGAVVGAFIGFCAEASVTKLRARFGANSTGSSRNKRTEEYLDKLDAPEPTAQ